MSSVDSFELKCNCKLVLVMLEMLSVFITYPVLMFPFKKFNSTSPKKDKQRSVSSVNTAFFFFFLLCPCPSRYMSGCISLLDTYSSNSSKPRESHQRHTTAATFQVQSQSRPPPRANAQRHSLANVVFLAGGKWHEITDKDLSAEQCRISFLLREMRDNFSSRWDEVLVTCVS